MTPAKRLVLRVYGEEWSAARDTRADSSVAMRAAHATAERVGLTAVQVLDVVAAAPRSELRLRPRRSLRRPEDQPGPWKGEERL